jgi:hypothetical protein
MITLFTNESFQFELEITLGTTYRQGADIGEVLTTAAAITDGDFAEGASLHCEPLASARRGQRIFDWLDGVLGTASA